MKIYKVDMGKLEELKNELNEKVKQGHPIKTLLPLSRELDKYIFDYIKERIEQD